MKSAATAAVESSSTTAVTPTLCEHRLRQPTERNDRNENNNDSK
jgi:hypothetical protein